MPFLNMNSFNLLNIYFKIKNPQINTQSSVDTNFILGTTSDVYSTSSISEFISIFFGILIVDNMSKL